MVLAAEAAARSKTSTSRKTASADACVGTRRSVRQLSRKRVVSLVEQNNCAENRQCGGGDASPELSALESLPEEVLIRVLCCVDRVDLHQLILVSKTIREAALAAKKLHFAYSTPPQIAAFRNRIDPVEAPANDGTESPVAPPLRPRRRLRPRLDARAMATVPTALFTADGADARLKRGAQS